MPALFCSIDSSFFLSLLFITTTTPSNTARKSGLSPLGFWVCSAKQEKLLKSLIVWEEIKVGKEHRGLIFHIVAGAFLRSCSKPKSPLQWLESQCYLTVWSPHHILNSNKNVSSMCISQPYISSTLSLPTTTTSGDHADNYLTSCLATDNPRWGGVTSDSHLLFHFQATFWLGKRLLQL